MEIKNKFVFQLTGPALKYRLDILAEACPNARHYIVCLTNRDSYDLYKEYHDFFTFVIMDDYRKDHPLSLKNETFPSYKTEEEFFANVGSFYGSHNSNYYSYDIHRFAFPYLIEKEILNFSFTDTDFILNNDPKILQKFFDSVPQGSCYGPWHSEDSINIEIKSAFWREEIQPHFPEFSLIAPFLRTIDGFIRGFHFNSIQDMKLVYDLWNMCIDKLLSIEKYKKSIVGNNGKILHTEWVISHIMQFLQYQKGYNFSDCFSYFDVDEKKLGSHVTRVEDTIYMVPRSYWQHYKFDYSDTSNISSFIKNNKNQLHNYYVDKFPIVKITDTHVYTKLN